MPTAKKKNSLNKAEVEKVVGLHKTGSTLYEIVEKTDFPISLLALTLKNARYSANGR